MNARPDVSRLLSIKENENTEPALQHGFAPGDATASSTYSYDGAGNMTNDPYKDIGITYNHLNLPEEIDGNKIIYDANGRKLLMEYADGSKRIYLAGMEFVDDKFESVNLGDGRIYTEEPDPTGLGGISESPISLIPEYWHKDHLGNIRVSFADKNGDKLVQLLDDGSGNGSEVNQILDYYPFGMQHPGQLCAPEVEPENAYRYNGKELLEEVGLYDYGARYYDPAVARWAQVDALAENMYEWSSYNYAFNNPIKYIDPDGNSPISAFARRAASLGLRRAGIHYVRSQVRRKLGQYSSQKWATHLLDDALTFVDNATKTSWWEWAIELVPVVGDAYGASKLGKQGYAMWRGLRKLEAVAESGTRAASKAWKALGPNNGLTGKGNDLLNGYITKFNNQGTHLNADDLGGAVKEIFGMNSNGQHLKEANEALNGMGTQITKLTKDIADGKFEGDSLEAATGVLNATIRQYQEASRALDSARRAAINH